MKPEEIDNEILGMIAATSLVPKAQYSVQDVKDRVTNKFDVSAKSVEESLQRLIRGGELEHGQVGKKIVLTLSEI